MSEPNVIVESVADHYIRQVQWKLAAGEYRTEPVACFCGSSESRLVTDKDRYGLPHAMQMCKHCGILYANPRMTDDSYAEFYAQEYRDIYRTEDDSAEQEFETGAKHAEALRQYLDETQSVKPSVVYDIGCNAGGWLKPFFDAGCDVHGVDYGPDRVSFGRERGLPLSVGSIEVLEIMGSQADLIIMNHVLEHATNLESTLRRVRDLLKPNGLLYVALPGLLNADLHYLFQNAHPWQFTAETLTYVMQCCGFEEIQCNHDITSLWRKTDEYRAKSNTPDAFIRDIELFLFQRGKRYIPKVRTGCKFPLKDRQVSVRSAIARKLPTCTDLIDKHVGRSAIILGGGPSADAYVETIRQFQRDGSILISVERMARWCLQHDLTPDYIVTMDASDDVLDAFQAIPIGSIHLVASQCQPAVLDRLAGETVYLVHNSEHDLDIDELMGHTDHCTIVNAGGSVTLASWSLSMLMGMQTTAFFGFDCHVTNGGYAKGIAGVGEQKELLPVKIKDRAFTTTLSYLAFAQQFFQLKDQGEKQGVLKSVKVYGDSLVTSMSVHPIGDQA